MTVVNQHAKAFADAIIKYSVYRPFCCRAASRATNMEPMNSPNFVRTSLIATFALTVTCLVADAQVSGTGTTGVTAGSGRGTGSAGVMTGTGPDVRTVNAEQPIGAVARQNITTATTARGENISSAKKESQGTRKHLKKTNSHSRPTPTPGAAASPR
jgi:hypothetical protein